MSQGSLPKTHYLICERDDGWLTVWLNRPDVRNALSNEMFGEIRAVITAIRSDETIRGVTFRGKGGIFSAGGDLKMFSDIFQGAGVSPESVARSSRLYGEIYREIETLPQFVMALVEGAAIAGGLGIVCAADMAIVARDAKFALTETTLGIPPAQIAPLIVRAIGAKAARRLMLTASRFDGEEAGRLGLADMVVDDARGLDAAEVEIRKRVLRCAPQANARTKHLALAVGSMDERAFIDKAAKAYTECMLSDEGREGIASFFDKRRPSWATD